MINSDTRLRSFSPPITGKRSPVVRLSLEQLVTSVATDLMSVTAPTLHSASESLLHQLVDYFAVDLSFLRRHDHSEGTTTLVAEWPPRSDIPDPDPLGVVRFADADPIFAATEHLSTVMLTRPDGTDADYQDRVRLGSGIEGGVSSATVPLLDANGTVGVLGLIKYGDRHWHDVEINALRTVAAFFTQIHARVAAEERLRHLAFHDELTGLANRRALVGYLAGRMDSGFPEPVAVIFMDVDRLKSVNSFFGHTAGDEFLRTLAGRLKDIAGGDHRLGRLGGDEFVLVMSGWADEASAFAMADRLRRAAREPIDLSGEEISRGVSLGLALATPGELTVSELMGRADQAMMQSKARGGNEITVFTADMRRRNGIRTDIDLHLGTAIRNGSLTLHYQPEVNLVTGSIVGVEALVRWPHPTLGLLQPHSFIDIVEATKLAGELGRWVIETGCRQLTEWHQEHPGLRLSVNVSPAQLLTLDFVSSVAQILHDCNLEPRHLAVEITERALILDTDRALATLRGLKDIGVTVAVAVADFGAGCCSFAQLKSLPVDTLKIDRGFVRDLGVGIHDRAIVRSIIGLADSFGLHIVAEGVETEIAAATLVALGCSRAQGFLFAKPGPAWEIESVLDRGIPKFGEKRPAIR
jgi:diguanylate cyclase (GGDEF)-like protein